MTWLRNNWLNLVVGIAILAIVLFGLSSLRGCGASAATSSGPSPWFFIIFSIVMFLIGAKNKDQKYFGAPLLYFGIILFCLGSIGGIVKISGFFSKNPNYSTLIILGLVVVAGIYGYNKTGEGFLKRTLGAITAGLALFLVGLAITKFAGIDFSKSIDFSKISLPNFSFPADGIVNFLSNPMILLFGTTALFAIIWWKRKGRLVGLIALILFFLLLGQGFFDLLSSRWPRQIPTPATIGQGIGDAAKDIKGYIPKPQGYHSSQSPNPASLRWVEFAKVDFWEVSCQGMLKNPQARVDLPRGKYLLSPTVQVKIGAGGWFVQTQFTVQKEMAAFIKPPEGNINKVVTIYKEEWR